MIVDFDPFLAGKWPYDLKAKLDIDFFQLFEFVNVDYTVQIYNLFCFCRFSKMPCCCKDNVQASFVIGIVLAVLCLIGIAGDSSPLGITLAIVGALIHCILIFGAHKRLRTAILGRFKTFLFPFFFLYFLTKIKRVVLKVSVAFPVVFLLPFCCLSIVFLSLFSCLLEIERKQKDNRKTI